MAWYSRVTRIALAAIAAACTSTTRPSGEWKIDYGLLLPPVDRVLVITDTVALGSPVPVTVNTFGSSSCVRPAGVAITGAGSRGQVLTPRDSVPQPGAPIACTDDLATRPHPTVLTFEHEGVNILRVLGYLAEADGTRRLGFIDRIVVVRP